MDNTHSGRHLVVAGKPRHLKGWKRDLVDHRDLLLAPRAGEPLPASVDLRNLITHIEDQGDLGSCTANAATSAMESLAKKEGRELHELSRLFTYYYTRKIEGTPATEDTGATLRNTMKALVVFGACAETCWPYDVSKFSSAPSFKAYVDARRHRVTRYYRCADLRAIRSSMAAGFTVVGGFSVPETIFDAPGGVVPVPTPNTAIVGGHAIHFVGYDDSSALLAFQNSWGANWGNQGIGYLPYWFVENGMADDFWTIRNETPSIT